MRFARSALAAAGLAVAMLNVTGPALADTKPSPVPATRSSSAPSEAPAETPVPAPATRSGSEPAPAEAPAQADPTRAEPRPVPEGAPETGGGPVGSALVPAGLVPVGGVLLLAGAGTGLLALRRRKHARV
ncbi:hypothetical protein [Streptosporangium vulgare]|uniref:Gram-positive cocci surface proteins LPxTG domain-containing protein n=1 Tax=Streptosporangium vulgare TaxID=46190 RepID=A0ABV5TCF9_9ACTN